MSVMHQEGPDGFSANVLPCSPLSIRTSLANWATCKSNDPEIAHHSPQTRIVLASSLTWLQQFVKHGRVRFVAGQMALAEVPLLLKLGRSNPCCNVKSGCKRLLHARNA
eukprot:5375534-Amphidinium_carterae.1